MNKVQLPVMFALVGISSCVQKHAGNLATDAPHEIQAMVDRIDSELAEWPEGWKAVEWEDQPRWCEALILLGEAILEPSDAGSVPLWLEALPEDEYVVAKSFRKRGLPDRLQVFLFDLQQQLGSRDGESAVCRELIPARLSWGVDTFRVLDELLLPSESRAVHSILEECAIQIWNNSDNVFALTFCTTYWDFLEQTNRTRMICGNDNAIGEVAAFRLLNESRSMLIYLQEDWSKSPEVLGVGVSADSSLNDALVMLTDLCSLAGNDQVNWFVDLPSLAAKGRKSFLRIQILLNVDPLQDWDTTRPQFSQDR